MPSGRAGGRVRLQDVADLAGVSMKTVSNVVRGYQHISPAMRDKVEALILARRSALQEPDR